MRSHIGWRGERSIPYKGVETSPSRRVLKTMRLTAIRNGPKRTISASGRLGILQLSSLKNQICALRVDAETVGLCQGLPLGSYFIKHTLDPRVSMLLSLTIFFYENSVINCLILPFQKPYRENA